LDTETFKNIEVIEFLNENVLAIKMHADSIEGKELIDYYNIYGFPTIVFVDSDSNEIDRIIGNEIDRIIGYLPPEQFLGELQRIQRGENTIKDYINRTNENPEDFELWKMLAQKYDDRGDLKSAVEVWESVAEANIGDKLLINYKLIELYGQLNQDVKGLEKFVAENLDSDFTPYAFRNIINIQRKNKDKVGESNTWNKFVNYMELKEKQTSGFYNSFAWRMSELGMNLERALEKIRLGIDQIAADDSSTLAGYKDTEAEVLWKMGNVDEALKIIDECIALQPDDKYFQNQKDKFLNK
jgi:tetratricopeptide (TPR) repeat protein